MTATQYDIVLVDLDPTRGTEMKKTRPCAILSPDEMNRHLQTVVIAPITTTSNAYPTRLAVKGSKINGWLVLDQILTIDKSRIISNLDALSPAEITRTKAILRETFVD